MRKQRLVSLVLIVAVVASVLVGVAMVSASCGNFARCWQQVASANPGSGDNSLSAVTVVNSTNVWAVGAYVPFDGIRRTLIEHGVPNGSGGWSWTQVSSPNPSSNGNELNGVGFARNDLNATTVWAVGYSRDSSDTPRTLIQGYISGTWTTVASPNVGVYNNTLNAVAGSKATNYWAVGQYYDGGKFKTLTLAYTSTVLGWQVVASPNLGAGGVPAPQNYLTSVTVVDSSHVYAAGYYTDINGSTHPLLLTWNGIAWAASDPTAGVGTYPFYGIAFSSASSGFAVGGNNPAKAYQYMGDNLGWLPNSPSTNATGPLFGASWVGTNQLWAVGSRHVGSSNLSQTQYWDGSGWTYYQAEDPSGSTEVSLRGVDGIANTDTWAVGKYLSNGRYLTLVEHYN